MSDVHSQHGEGSHGNPSEEYPSSDSGGSEALELSSEGSKGSMRSSNIRLIDPGPTLQFLLDNGFFTVGEFHIKLGQSILDIPREGLLNCLWTNDLDTPCMVCGERFDDTQGPPIRTYSIDKDDNPEAGNLMLAFSKLTIHVHNRHLECAVKLNVQFITVSHVWHEEVAEAHLSRRSTDEAVALAWFVPIRILNAVTFSLERDYDKVELWHDYLSVPQWNYTVQQQLLLYLPAIYKASPLCLIHLDDTSNSILEIAFSSTTTPREVVDSIGQFSESHWFSRLWVALEYISCSQACLMVETNQIIKVWQSLDSFTHTMDFFNDRDRSICIKEGVEFTDETTRRFPRHFRNILSSMRRSDAETRVLGDAYHILSDLECRTYRDRFIAIIGLLGLGDYTEIIRQIPRNTTAACHWVAMKCLERGDYTPLLLVHTGEPDVPYARWLRGHERMHNLMWTPGKIDGVPKSLKILHNGRVEPKLEYVGIIEESYYIGFELRWEISAFEFVVTSLLQKKNKIFSAADFVNTLLRIYAVPPYITANYPEIPNSLDQYCAQNPDFESEIMAIIVIYLKLMPRTGPADRLTICKLLATKLFFDKVYTSNLKSYTRLTYAGSYGDAEFYLDLLVRVRCGGCHLPFVFRVALYNAYKIGCVGQKLYRIPGLSCLGFPGNGMCLIMAGSLIRGRSTFGTPACACSIRESVLIE